MPASTEGCDLDDLIIYGGIIFKEDPVHKTVKARNERFEITDPFIDDLDRRFKNIELALSPQVEDMRPFLWHNYHSPQKQDKYLLDLRYTSYLDITSLTRGDDEEETVLFKNLDTLRQRNIREARKEKAVVRIEPITDRFIHFYEKMMVAQGLVVDAEKLKRMVTLVNALTQHGQAVSFATYNAAQEIIYTTIFCYDEKRAYYLFGAGSQENNERYKGTICFWDSFRFLARQFGVKEVDLEGVNSPQRGTFNLGFGGNLMPYYQVYKRRE